MKMFDRLPHPHVVSLEKKQDRRKSFFASAALHGIRDIEWFHAVNGNEIATLPEWARMNGGAYGCLHSHVALYKKALANGWEALTVFEDDVEIRESESVFLEELNRRAPDVDYFNLYPSTGWCLGTFGYVIFPEFMRCLVSLVEAQPFPEGKFGHIDQLIHSLMDHHGWVGGRARRPLVVHLPRYAGNSDIKWMPCRSDPSAPDRNLVSTFVEPACGVLPPPRVLVAISSLVGNSSQRDAIRSTWLSAPPQGVRARFFVGQGSGKSNPQPREDDLEIVAHPDDDPHGIGKLLAFFRSALEGEPFDYLLKCNDDTYLHLERALGMIVPGVDLLGNELLVRKHGYACGSAGYILSRALVEALVADEAIPRNGPEDILISRAAMRRGTRVRHTLLLGGLADGRPKDLIQRISICWCKPDRMRSLHGLLQEGPIAAIETIHNRWRDILLFYAGGEFYRSSTPCSGMWAIENDRLVLRWFDWPEEIMGSVSESEELQKLAASVRC